MRYFPLLGEKKTKKALLKNAKNLKQIYDMYWERLKYEVIFPDRTETKQKFKFNVLEIMKKFNINSINELVFLLCRYQKPIKVCEFCNEDIYRFPLRTNIYVDDCKHIGICRKCNQPAIVLDENNYCCVPTKGQIFLRNLGTVLNLIQLDECEIRENEYDHEILIWVINFIEVKLNIFKKILKENGTYHESQGCEDIRDHNRGNNMRKNKDYLL